ncbi:AaceriAGR203Cp [[Ashbya] aceris (nom. inval.)]|nr:AaceriAGR203Cp [[Ashbya] aceris (nom. inval.)]
MVVMRFTSGIGLHASRRLLSSSAIVRSSGSKQQSGFNIRYLGVTDKIYVPTTYRNLPSVFSSPLVVANALIRRIYMLGLNTVHVALFRVQSGYKPKFLLWKNKAIETYVEVNRAFARRDVEAVKPLVSLWVQEALEARERQLPKRVEMEWDLVKFNGVPKLVAVQPIMLPGQPLEIVQLVYRFDTRQRLIKVERGSSEVEKVDRNVVDHVAFICDASTDEMLLVGTVFEAAPDAKLPTAEASTEETLQQMRICGDIYRTPPALKQKA